MALTMANNVVEKDTLRTVQKKVLQDLSEQLQMSFGPMGSNSCIKKIGANNQYSKDGHTILKNIVYHGIIEESIREDIESITTHIVSTIGDGTTSAVILSNLIFKGLVESKALQNMPPVGIINIFTKVVNAIKNEIRNNGHECTIDDIFDICMVSTNGNTEVSGRIKDIYEEFGLTAFIDVFASTGTEDVLKTYDGMNLESGYCNSCFINDTTTNSCNLANPYIYFFRDPIDTQEMLSMLNAIFWGNVFTPIQNNNLDDVKPTVIVAPHISRDMEGFMSSVIKLANETNVPILIINDVANDDRYEDIISMCSNGKYIRKFIDPKLQEAEIEAGRAPTPDTVCEWYGTCERIISDANRTKFSNPQYMRNEDGSFTDIFNGLINFLESELKTAIEEGDTSSRGQLKRRINSLKANMVEYYVGGITTADRDSIRDLVEDAVLNCRSAAINGVGYGANFEGLLASAKTAIHSYDMTLNAEFDAYVEIAKIIHASYNTLSAILYSTVKQNMGEDYIDYAKLNRALLKHQGYKLMKDCETAFEMVYQSLVGGKPYNIRTDDTSYQILSSIESDIIVLDSIRKIVGLMVTCNQFIVPNPQLNIYRDFNN